MTFKKNLIGLAIASFLSSPLLAADYEITITNITHGQIFTPILVATHEKGLGVFKLGEPAIPELETLAESGNPAPGTALLQGLGNAVGDVKDSGAVLPPGQSVTLTLSAEENHGYFLAAAMLIPTNDAFFAVNGKALPAAGETVTYYSDAYDAGTEINDENCDNIPGPPSVCSGEGVSEATGEGFVHVHNGIHGIADLGTPAYDWRSVVAKITVTALPE